MARLRNAATLEARVASSQRVQEHVEAVARELETELRDLVRLRALDTGVLANQVRVIRDGDARIVRFEAGPGQPRKLPIWIEHGTGIYGPKKQPIRPKKGKYLVFKVKDTTRPAPAGLPSYPLGERPVFAKQVRGRPASHVVRDAVAIVSARHRLRFTVSNH